MKLESRLRAIAASVLEGQLRAFGCACCRRLLPFFDVPILQEVIVFGESRSAGKFDVNDLIEIRDKSDIVYRSLYPGYDDPSADTLALCAAGEVAFTDSSLSAAINASEFAARALAKLPANLVPDEDYDTVYEPEFAKESANQLELLKQLIPAAAD